jgi:hypothetical protein
MTNLMQMFLIKNLCISLVIMQNNSIRSEVSIVLITDPIGFIEFYCD